MPARKKTESKSSRFEGIVFVVSLGCPKNLVDTEVMTGILLSNGFRLSLDPRQADIYLINTCAFIPPARAETAAALEEAASWKRKSPRRRRIIVTGCLIHWDRSGDFRKQFPAVDLWAGVDDIPRIARLIKRARTAGNTPLPGPNSSPPSFLYDENLPRLQLTLPHIAYLKIADGCDNRCSYCAIPDIRGRLRSRTLRSVVAEAETARNNGAAELLLLAQDTTAFGSDRGGRDDLSALLHALDQPEGNFWIRLLYTHPAHFRPELIELIAAGKHILPYIDLPLQHISDKLLSSMRRRISAAATRELLKRLRQNIPGLAIRTTFITGLPGETADDFKLLRDFILEQEFERLGVFSYSPEPGTPAAGFSAPVPAAVAAERAAELMRVQAKISLKKNKSLVGREFDVIVDVAGTSSAVGRSYMDAPEIDNCVVLPKVRTVMPGKIYRSVITGAAEYELTAKLKTESGRHK
ncbi:MAG: 30S ribosomal protein S12 methylthiotransferase RimO [Victivallaceae bacterium]|nr:30S ribosomal protein S12 methylthiotransferase RimO [Victivallaceae bacterium]